MKAKQTILFIGVGLLLSGAGLYIYNRTKGGTSVNDNFSSLLKNLGPGTKPNSEGIVIVKFNSNKNSGQFYNNGRVMIVDVSTNKVIKKGSYYDGGLKITIDGQSPITSSSVWSNLLKTI